MVLELIMAMTKAGLIKRKATLIEKHESYEKYIQFMREIGKSGGEKITENTRKKGWGSNKELAAEQGYKRRKQK